MTVVPAGRQAANRETNHGLNAHRIDAHPVWDATGRFVVFNGVHDDTRSVFVADPGAWLKDAMQRG